MDCKCERAEQACEHRVHALACAQAFSALQAILLHCCGAHRLTAYEIHVKLLAKEREREHSARKHVRRRRRRRRVSLLRASAAADVRRQSVGRLAARTPPPPSTLACSVRAESGGRQSRARGRQSMASSMQRIGRWRHSDPRKSSGLGQRRRRRRGSCQSFVESAVAAEASRLDKDGAHRQRTLCSLAAIVCFLHRLRRRRCILDCSSLSLSLVRLPLRR